MPDLPISMAQAHTNADSDAIRVREIRVLNMGLGVQAGLTVAGFLTNFLAGETELAGRVVMAQWFLPIAFLAVRLLGPSLLTKNVVMLSFTLGTIGLVLAGGGARSTLFGFLFVIPMSAALLMQARGLLTWTPVIILLAIELEDGALGPLRWSEGGFFEGPTSWLRKSDLGFAILAISITSLLFVRIAQAAFEEARATARRLEAEVEERRAAELRAKAGAKAKSDFLAMMSHEIRTPLNGILGMAQLLDDKVVDGEGHELVSVLQSSGQSLLTILNDVLDYSKVEAGKLTVESTRFDLHASLRHAGQLVESTAHTKGLELRVEIEPGVPRWTEGDPGRLGQILLNLLVNAVKFTERGEVVLRAGGAPGAVRMDVVDSGIGISEETQARLFRPFEQAETSTHRRFGGTGLGLAVSHRLVGLMGGELTVSSVLGEGSTFTVRLPLPEVDAPAVEAAAKARPRRIELKAPVLVVDDNAVNRMVAERLLVRLGVEVECVDSGAAAIEKVRTQTYAAVLMDVHMPEMDGYEATTRIRELDAGATVPIVGLSASAQAEDRALALASSMQAYLTKPVDIDALARCLAGLEAGAVE